MSIEHCDIFFFILEAFSKFGTQSLCYWLLVHYTLGFFGRDHGFGSWFVVIRGTTRKIVIRESIKRLINSYFWIRFIICDQNYQVKSLDDFPFSWLLAHIIIITFNARYITSSCLNNSHKLLLIDSFFFQNLFLESFKSPRFFDLENPLCDSWNMFCLFFSDDQRGLGTIVGRIRDWNSEYCDFDGIEGDLGGRLLLF